MPAAMSGQISADITEAISDTPASNARRRRA